MSLTLQIPLQDRCESQPERRLKIVGPRPIWMRHVALIYNPYAGQHSERRKALIENCLVVLRAAGIEAEALETHSPGTAGQLAMEAVRRGCDTILACGGDGTVHEILQCLVGTRIALGVVPLGTANALAMDLGLGSKPAKALRLLLDARPVQVPVGRISFKEEDGSTGSRYFTVAAGVGVDALFMSRLDPELKRRFGYALYLVEAFRVWATHSFQLFRAAFVTHHGRTRRVEHVSQLLAVRIRDFGGALRNLAPGATLHKGRLRLVAFKTRSRLRYLRFLIAVLFGRQTFTGAIELLDAVSVECRAGNGSTAHVYAEADGELLGVLPVRIEIVPQALTLLIPVHAKP
jgi:YegS/Rv2252/BmrU family lipid kinase